MKTFKSILFSLFAIAAIAVFMTSCEQEQVMPDAIEQIILEDAEGADINERRRDPCYPTGGVVIPYITTEVYCLAYRDEGFRWSNGKCWACY